MALLATVFLGGLFSSWIPAEEAKGYIAGLILLGAAPCTGMVFVWSRPTAGDATFDGYKTLTLTTLPVSSRIPSGRLRSIASKLLYGCGRFSYCVDLIFPLR